MTNELHFRVLGTKCASCEIILERELRTLPGVAKVMASHEGGKVTLVVEEGVGYTPADLEKKVSQHGYRFATSTSAENNFSWGRLLGAAGLVVIVYLFLDQFGILSFSPQVSAAGGFGAVFVVGLVAAFSSCTAVVGGLIAALSARLAQSHANASLLTKMRPHILFNIGRIAGFALLGAAIGALGSVMQLSTAMNGFLVVAIAILMIVIGVQLMGVLPPGLAVIRPPKALAHKIHNLTESNNPLVPAVLGGLTFFLPCGFTQSMQLFALASGDPIQAAIIMGVFALGTTPALIGIGFVTSAAKGQGLKLVTQGVGALVIALGISNVANGATLLGYSGFTVSNGDEVTNELILVDGAQIVEMEVTPYGAYSPSTLRVTEDVPVKWQIYGGESMGCADILVMPAFNIQKSLNPGFNEVTFTPTKAGKFTFSCSMGMVRGTMIVEPKS